MKWFFSNETCINLEKVFRVYLSEDLKIVFDFENGSKTYLSFGSETEKKEAFEKIQKYLTK